VLIGGFKMSKTKIVVIQLKEIIYTAIFVGLGILLILLLIFMFVPKNSKSNSSGDDATYKPGIYTSQLTLNNTLLNVEVTVDENHIKSVKIANLNDSITTMFPLMEPALEKIESQLCNGSKIEEITLSKDSKYTQTLLLEAVETSLNKAIP
jgi:uncharacterized protein with FMN-binding domain